MSDSGTGFRQLIDRLRSGDQAAAVEILQEYEPQIRRLVRLRLTSSQLRRTLDSTDICQSVFAAFFAQVDLNRLDLEKPANLLALLATMARNKVIQRHRHEVARRPRGESVLRFELNPNEVASPEASPSSDLCLAELFERVNQVLSDKERQIAAMRKDGSTWAEIGERLGETKDAVRKQFERALQLALKRIDNPQIAAES